MNNLRNCTGKPQLIVPCDIYAPIGKLEQKRSSRSQSESKKETGMMITSSVEVTHV
jgi:hypothetical protein